MTLRTFFLAAGFSIATVGALAQTPLIEIQGQTDVSPFVGQEVTVQGKVTEYFGETWYIQDDYGAWNGLYCVGPDVLLDANPPWWNEPRHPEVGDVLELTGTIEEVDGNTQIANITAYTHVDFWNATPIGTELEISALQDESLEGTRVRLPEVTVLSVPDGQGYWSVADATGSTVLFGVDTDDPGMSEDPDGPTPGDVYKVYGALRQVPGGYQVDVGDIDTLALVSGIELIEPEAFRFQLYPNPASLQATIDGGSAPYTWHLLDSQGLLLREGRATEPTRIDLSAFPVGTYTVVTARADQNTKPESQQLLIIR